MSGTKISMALAVALLWCFLLSGCNRPNESKVRQAFISEYPAYRDVSVVATEGDGAAAYFRIRYKRPNDERQYEDMWQYLMGSDGEWKLNHRETLKP